MDYVNLSRASSDDHHCSINITSLQQLDLNGNGLRGPIPDIFVKMTSFHTINFGSNKNLIGGLPKSLGGLCQLRTLDLSENTISDGISKCANTSLEVQYLQKNNLTSPLPDSLGHLNSLTNVKLGGNKMHGHIPISLGRLSRLEEFEVNGNSWEGAISEAHFATLKNLKGLYILPSSPRSLVINISSNWIPPFAGLELIDLSNCQVGPLSPSWIRTQRSLHQIPLDNAGIIDTIPDWFTSTYANLSFLVLSNNQIRGTVPLKYNHESSVGTSLSSQINVLDVGNNTFSGNFPLNINETMPMLTHLDVSRNMVNGAIPSAICGITSLRILILSSNQLPGNLPHCWENLGYLQVLDLSTNSLSGQVPDSIGSLGSLLFLMLSRNSFYGELPSSLQNCSQLRSIDLGENNFSAELPKWIGKNLTSLRILRLHSNSFRSGVPQELCNLSSLRILDLAHNELSGAIPHCLGSRMIMVAPVNQFSVNTSSISEQIVYVDDVTIRVIKGRELEYDKNLRFLVSIDLSCNHLSGAIPMQLTNLQGLNILNLSVNSLTGKIPEKMGYLRRLESLGLSRNQLSGEIPSSISDLTSLNHLNLSYNELVGRIPSGNQLQTLADPSIYEGNPKLCGPPLSLKCQDNETAPAPNHVNEDIEEDEDGFEKKWFFVSMAVGFVVGYFGLLGTLWIKKAWRNAGSRLHIYFTLVIVT
ncbi:hypothetical protein Sjap_001472 [Stephania japonica]|uniref:Disease resistance R13L4/SHOC-2-like LRR domain-containing protein n=1 Tax=Stephania japonica TaxID=461633 RepID=A0AAP0KMB4_9MAGN